MNTNPTLELYFQRRRRARRMWGILGLLALAFVVYMATTLRQGMRDINKALLSSKAALTDTVDINVVRRWVGDSFAVVGGHQFRQGGGVYVVQKNYGARQFIVARMAAGNLPANSWCRLEPWVDAVPNSTSLMGVDGDVHLTATANPTLASAGRGLVVRVEGAVPGGLSAEGDSGYVVEATNQNIRLLTEKPTALWLNFSTFGHEQLGREKVHQRLRVLRQGDWVVAVLETGYLERK